MEVKLVTLTIFLYLIFNKSRPAIILRLALFTCLFSKERWPIGKQAVLRKRFGEKC